MVLVVVMMTAVMMAMSMAMAMAITTVMLATGREVSDHSEPVAAWQTILLDTQTACL